MGRRIHGHKAPGYQQRQVEYMPYDRCGHGPNIEHPEYNVLVIEFLTVV